jgi:hypothetical protein
LRARGNRQQVRLPLRAGDFDQVTLAEPHRGGEKGDRIVIPGKVADDFERGPVVGLGERLRFNSLDQVPEKSSKISIC